VRREKENDRVRARAAEARHDLRAFLTEAKRNPKKAA
jgi:hypothetical protein